MYFWLFISCSKRVGSWRHRLLPDRFSAVLVGLLPFAFMAHLVRVVALWKPDTVSRAHLSPVGLLHSRAFIACPERVAATRRSIALGRHTPGGAVGLFLLHRLQHP